MARKARTQPRRTTFVGRDVTVSLMDMDASYEHLDDAETTPNAYTVAITYLSATDHASFGVARVELSAAAPVPDTRRLELEASYFFSTQVSEAEIADVRAIAEDVVAAHVWARFLGLFDVVVGQMQIRIPSPPLSVSAVVWDLDEGPPAAEPDAPG